MRDAFLKALTELAAADRRIMLLTADLGFGVFEGFAERFPHQYVNVGVAEQNMTGIATGLALEGHTVFTYSIGNFPTLRCLEQIRNDACYHGVNVNVVASGGGFSYGALGMSHHATEDLAILRALPDMTVVAPGDRWEAGEATLALARTPGVGYLRLDKTAASTVPSGGETFGLGRARRVREGSAATLICTGGILAEAMTAASVLAEQGVECRVVSMHTVKPIDKSEIRSAALETGGIVTVEEHNISGGLGSAVAEVCMDENVRPGFFSRVALNDRYSSIVGEQAYLRERYGLDAAAIAAHVSRNLNG